MAPSAERGSDAAPFLRWAGGKRWLLPILLPEIRQFEPKRYFEPFLGGGAAFFALAPKAATLSDANEELVNAYVQVRDRPAALVKSLAKLSVSRATFERVRSSAPSSDLDRATRFLYLNRTAFSGLYRVNRSGQFNVPYGGGDRTTAVLTSTDLLRDAAKRLATTRLVCSDFEPIIDDAKRGAVVYCDPCYVGDARVDSFRRYNADPFAWADQERLAEACLRAQARGAAVLVSNRPDIDTARLYPNGEVTVLDRASRISARPSGRGTRQEILVVLRPKPAARSRRLAS